MHIFWLVFLFLSMVSPFVRPSVFHSDPKFASMESLRYHNHNELRFEESLIPGSYNSLDPPPTSGGSPLRVNFSVVLMNIRDIQERKQEITMEMNLRIYWLDARLQNLTEGEDYVVLNPESFEKHLWRPDVFINHAKSVNHTALLTKPMSMRLYSDGSIRYSSRISITLACQMNFRYYPADTQHCKVDLMSYAYPRNILILGWHEGISARLASDLEISNFFLSLENTGEFFTTSTSGVYSGIRFTVKLCRNMSFHLLQTYLPSGMFILVTFMTFILPQDSGAVAIAMTALLSMTTLFAAVRQNTPNVSYAKAIDIWVVVCMLFEFLALGQHVITMRLRHFKIEPIKSAKTKDQSGDKAQNAPSIDRDDTSITFRGGNNGPDDVKNGRVAREARKHDKETRHPSPEELVAARIKEYKALGNKIRRMFSILCIASFGLFNIIYWTWLLNSREY